LSQYPQTFRIAEKH